MNSTANKLMEYAKKQALVVMLLAIIAAFCLVSPDFFSLRNFVSILRQIAIYGIMSCGITFVLIGGNIDLTAGALLSLTCCVMVRLHEEMGAIPGILVTLAVGMAVGSVTGYLVAYVRLNGLITTLGMQSIIISATKLYTNSRYFTIPTTGENWFRSLGQGNIGGFPVPTIIYLALLVAFQFFLEKTKFGIQLKAVGGNPVASNYSGIKNKRVVMLSFVISGLCVGIAGVVLASRGLAARVSIGDGFEFDVLAACVLSGTSLTGGVGSVSRAFLGIVIMGVLRNGYVMMGLPYYVQWLTQCIIILAVVTIDILSQKKVK